MCAVRWQAAHRLQTPLRPGTQAACGSNTRAAVSRHTVQRCMAVEVQRDTVDASTPLDRRGLYSFGYAFDLQPKKRCTTAVQVLLILKGAVHPLLISKRGLASPWAAPPSAPHHTQMATASNADWKAQAPGWMLPAHSKLAPSKPWAGRVAKPGKVSGCTVMANTAGGVAGMGRLSLQAAVTRKQRVEAHMAVSNWGRINSTQGSQASAVGCGGKPVGAHLPPCSCWRHAAPLAAPWCCCPAAGTAGSPARCCHQRNRPAGARAGVQDITKTQFLCMQGQQGERRQKRHLAAKGRARTGSAPPRLAPPRTLAGQNVAHWQPGRAAQAAAQSRGLLEGVTPRRAPCSAQPGAVTMVWPSTDVRSASESVSGAGAAARTAAPKPASTRSRGSFMWSVPCVRGQSKCALRTAYTFLRWSHAHAPPSEATGDPINGPAPPTRLPGLYDALTP